jgi:3-hydroxyisobutyrate dehydrogenase
MSELRAGVIGLGMIGSGVARLVAGAGFETLGYDVSADAYSALDGVLAPTESAAALADAADVVVVCVYDDGQVREALAGPNGVFSASAPPKAVVIVSTVGIDTIEWAGREAKPLGIGILDCGVAGGVALREGQRVVAMIGGDESAYETARPVLEAFGSPVARMGALGSGMRAKLARNMLHYGAVIAEWEGARLAEAAGVDLDQFIEIVKASEPWSVGRITRHPLKADLGEEGLFGGYAQKDIRAALELAEDVGLELRVAPVVGEVFAAAERAASPDGA